MIGFVYLLFHGTGYAGPKRNLPQMLRHTKIAKHATLNLMAPRKVMLREVLGRLPKKAAFIVRVVRLWIVTYKDNPNRTRYLSMVLQDSEGVRIQATADRELGDRFKELIVECGLCAMKNFNVQECENAWRPASHPYTLYFQADTNVGDNIFGRVLDFPLDIYKFKKVGEILQTPETNPAPDLIDFIGALLPNEKPWYGKPKGLNSNTLSFKLRDIEDKEISCSLWDAYADEARSSLCRDRNVTVVVLLQLCRIGRKKDNSIVLASSFYVTKVLIDAHIPEVEEFRNQFTAMYGFDTPRSGYLSSSSASARVVGPVSRISKLMSLTDAKGYWFYGKINTVLSREDLSYLGCVDGASIGCPYPYDGEYLCDKKSCGKRMETPIHRYRLMLEVKDKDRRTVVVFFDELCQRIFGKGALELHSEMDEAAETPTRILDLEGKCYLFKISDYSSVHDGVLDWYIGSLCDDPLTIGEYSQDDGYSSEESESDENLDLLLSNATQGDSNALAGTPSNANGDGGLTPFSKRRRDDEDDCTSGAPDTQNSSNLKLKSVKVEKP